jgi:hypothetical protein
MHRMTCLISVATILAAVLFSPAAAQLTKADLLGEWQCDSLIVKHYTKRIVERDTAKKFPDSVITNSTLTQAVVLAFQPNDTAYVPAVDQSYFRYSIKGDTGYLVHDTITVAFMESPDKKFLRSIKPLFVDVTIYPAGVGTDGTVIPPDTVDIKDYYAVFVKIPTAVKPVAGPSDRSGITPQGGLLLQGARISAIDILGRRMAQPASISHSNGVILQIKMTGGKTVVEKSLQMR